MKKILIFLFLVLSCRAMATIEITGNISPVKEGAPEDCVVYFILTPDYASANAREAQTAATRMAYITERGTFKISIAREEGGTAYVSIPKYRIEFPLYLNPNDKIEMNIHATAENSTCTLKRNGVEENSELQYSQELQEVFAQKGKLQKGQTSAEKRQFIDSIASVCKNDTEKMRNAQLHNGLLQYCMIGDVSRAGNKSATLLDAPDVSLLRYAVNALPFNNEQLPSNALFMRNAHIAGAELVRRLRDEESSNKKVNFDRLVDSIKEICPGGSNGEVNLYGQALAIQSLSEFQVDDTQAAEWKNRYASLFTYPELKKLWSDVCDSYKLQTEKWKAYPEIKQNKVLSDACEANSSRYTYIAFFPLDGRAAKRLFFLENIACDYQGSSDVSIVFCGVYNTPENKDLIKQWQERYPRFSFTAMSQEEYFNICSLLNSPIAVKGITLNKQQQAWDEWIEGNNTDETLVRTSIKKLCLE
jgi:hypothetical protein